MFINMNLLCSFLVQHKTFSASYAINQKGIQEVQYDLCSSRGAYSLIKCQSMPHMISLRLFATAYEHAFLLFFGQKQHS